MKKIIYTIILMLFIGNNVKAQEEIENFKDINGRYIEISDIDLNRFKGTWTYSEGVTSYKIKIEVKKRVYVASANYYLDKLEAYFCFEDNSGCMLDSKVNKFIIDYTEQNLSGDTIKLNFTDPITQKLGVGEFKITSTNKALWQARSRTFLYRNKEKTFRVPTDVILTKQ